jgi:hypothetical protein
MLAGAGRHREAVKQQRGRIDSAIMPAAVTTNVSQVSIGTDVQ